MAEPAAQMPIVRVTPAQIANHQVAQTYTITAISAEDFKNKYGGVDFDYQTLQKEFKKLCPDYMLPITEESKYQCIDFCGKIIYEVGPESRKVKKGSADKMWKFLFANDKVVYVSTFKGEAASYVHEANENIMVLPVRQASLIAMHTFLQICEWVSSQPGADSVSLLTPLAGACFSKDDIPRISEILNCTKTECLLVINASCQSSGQYLAASNGSVALCAAYSATRGLKDKKIKQSIVSKVIKQYMHQRKAPETLLVHTLAPYCNGGIPAEFSMEKLDEIFSSASFIGTSMQQIMATRQSAMQSTVPVPSQYVPQPTAPPSVSKGTIPKKGYSSPKQ